MKVLVIGSGGREHAIAWKLKQSPHLKELFIAPGNPGTATLGTNVELGTTNIGALALWAIEQKIDLTVVGPEQPLSEGVVDIFSQHGLRIVGPTRQAAQMEVSKAFAKDVMIRAGVPTARGTTCSDFDSAKEYIHANPGPIVVKADGLAAGKGVVVAANEDEALSTLEQFMLAGKLGDAGRTVVLEEKLEGHEASVIALVDGEVVLPMVVSQDHKRVFDGDQGPNTGGMGAISPTPVLGEHRLENLVGEIFIPVVNELMNRGIHYRGFLYAGVMIDPTGKPNVLEFNTRLGDPETQVLMMRMESDLLEVLDAAASNKLRSVEFRWKSEAAACVVISSRGYPGNVEDGKVISGLFEPQNDLVVFHAGTESSDGKTIRSKGGRILGVTALGQTLPAAVRRAYEGVGKISFDGAHYRKDIGGGSW